MPLADGDPCVHELFEAQVERTPAAVAVIDRDVRLTYRELDDRAQRLAHALRASGVTVETSVGVCCEPSAGMIVALLAILKAGGVYVPLDATSPRSWLASVLDDARIAVVLTQSALVDRFRDLSVSTLSADEPRAGLTTLLATKVTAANAMHILYTSGSAGKAKGVIGVHRATVNRLRWAQEQYPYAPGEMACARTTLGFVDSVAEIFAPLVSAIPLVILGREARNDLRIMIAELAAARVTRIVLVPSLLTTLFEVCPNLGERLPLLRYWFASGEPLPAPLADWFKRSMPGHKLVNLYGSTEVAGDATFFDLDRMRAGELTVPIGAPIRGVHARIVDEALAEVADGSVGEICISGACLARGYFGGPELTAARFVANPFAEGGLLFRTGDLGRRLASGDIAYVGRTDQQVKIRGARVDLGEVESLLERCPGVSQAVAVARSDANDRRTLVAFYTRSGLSLETSDLRAHFARLVPEHMIPSRFIARDAFPSTPNGKIDRGALSERNVATHSRRPPRTNSEARIGAAWEAVLECGPIGSTQSFYDVGGNSLAAMRIAVKLRDELALDVPVTAIFAHPTIAGLATYLDEVARAALPAVGRVRTKLLSGSETPSVLPLTYYQFPFWLFTALTGSMAIVSDAFGFTRAIDVEQLQQAFSETVATFDALWMAFSRWSPVQGLRARRPSRFLVVDRRATSDAHALQREADANNTMPFLLESPPHIHARLVRLEGGDDRLLVAMPHLVVDMTAMDLFRRTLQDKYARIVAPARDTASLHDLVTWEREAALDSIEADARYWRELSVGPAWNTMPARLFTTKLAGRSARALSSRVIAPELALRVEAYSRAHALSVPNTMIGAIYAALVRTAGRDDLTLLLMLEKRVHDETRDLFSNLTSMMRCGVPNSGAGPIDELVARMGARLSASYGHTDHQMRRPTQFNDFWVATPRHVRSFITRLGGILSRRWPKARLDPSLFAEYVFALVPFPADVTARARDFMLRRAPTTRDILVAVNILPEVHQASERGGAFGVRRHRNFAMIVKPGDLVINTDLLLDTTLQIHLTRNERGHIVSNLYGGGMDQSGLDEINDRIVEILETLASGGGAEHVFMRSP